MSGLVSIVIPNWNGSKFLSECLNSLYLQDYKEIEIIVVDNGSSDNSIEYLEKEHSQISLIRFSENRGFSAAVNEGIRRARGRYIALLNNDTKSDPNWIHECVSMLEARPDISVCAPKMLSYSDPLVIDGLGDIYTTKGTAFRYGHRQKDRGGYESPFIVFGACGGAVLFRRSVFDIVGLFDEDFFCYYEDVDFSFRTVLAGLKSIYVPNAIVYHIGSATTGSSFNSFTVFYNARNSVSVIVKNMPSKLIFRYFFRFVVNYGGTILFTYRKKLVFPYLKGLLSGLFLVPKMLKKRGKIQQLRKIEVADLVLILEDCDRKAQEHFRVLRNQESEG